MENNATIMQSTLNNIESRSNFSYDLPDRRRLEYAFGLVTGSSIVDIGIADGALVHAASSLPKIQKATGVDIFWHSRLVRSDKVDYRQISILDKEFDVEPHDTVVCMEVLEHLYSKDTDFALSRLRSLTLKRLIVSVPFQEPEPLWWHDKPGGHR